MRLRVFTGKDELGRAAAQEAADAIQAAVAERGRARIVAATGTSQFEFLAALVARTDLPWDRVELFHLDEYLRLPDDHPASFRQYLRKRLIGPTGLAVVHLLDGERGVAEATVAIAAAPVDVAFVGIGENAHLAFNDPPADFTTDEPYLVVELDAACRRQQVNEGWFADVADVPTHAVTMSVRQILAARRILAVVPDARKAEAVRAALTGPVTPEVPASILQTHPDTTVFLDDTSAALL